MKGFFISAIFLAGGLSAQGVEQDSLSQIEAVRFIKRLPMSKEVISLKKLSNKNLGQDIPYLLKNQVSMDYSSDTGNGIGYTGLRIRGTSGRGINVMLNGVPYNDSESQGTFFVNISDIASSASRIVIQRGVGTSTNGTGAFGASVDIISKEPENIPMAGVGASAGSFRTFRHWAEVHSGKFLNDKLSVFGRFTKTDSDGYRDRAFSDLQSYNVMAMFESGKTKIKFLTFGGKEKTYQTWNGISQKQMEENPRYTSDGAIYDDSWSKVIGFYDNETDNYRQNHYHLVVENSLGTNWKNYTTLYYTKGKGYYENYKQDSKFLDYGLANIFQGTTEIKRDNLIRKKWLDNDFYGLISNFYGKYRNWDFNLGLLGNEYKGWHFGNVSSLKFQNIDHHEYYRNLSTKQEFSGFAKAIFKYRKFQIFGDVQLRHIGYNTRVDSQKGEKGQEEGFNSDKKWTFFNPKAGVSYLLPEGQVYFSVAVAHREPNRSDLEVNIDTRPEKLVDYELGVETKIGSKVSVLANAYYMDYRNQLIQTGQVDDVGNFIRTSADNSYRMGLELGFQVKLLENLSFNGNANLSKNKIKKILTHDANKNVVELNNVDISYSPNKILNAGLIFSPFKNFEMGVQARHIGSQYFSVDSQNQEFKLKDYSTADATLRYKFPLNRADVELNLLLNNLFDRKFVNNAAVWVDDWDNNKVKASYYPQAGFNFLFGINVWFK